MEAVIENKVRKLETFRIPVDGYLSLPKNGIGYPILLDWDANRLELFQFIYGYNERRQRPP